MRSMHDCEDDKAQEKVSEAVNGRSEAAVECLTGSNCGGQERTQSISDTHSPEYVCML